MAGEWTGATYVRVALYDEIGVLPPGTRCLVTATCTTTAASAGNSLYGARPIYFAQIDPDISNNEVNPALDCLPGRLWTEAPENGTFTDRFDFIVPTPLVPGNPCSFSVYLTDANTAGDITMWTSHMNFTGAGFLIERYVQPKLSIRNYRAGVRFQ